MKESAVNEIRRILAQTKAQKVKFVCNNFPFGETVDL